MHITNPAFAYDMLGQDYSGQHQTENRIFSFVDKILDVTKTVLNIGAGADSYKPANRYVIAIEPSVTMRS